MCVYTYMCVCEHVCMYMYLYLYAYIYIYIYIYLFVASSLNVHISLYVSETSQTLTASCRNMLHFIVHDDHFHDNFTRLRRNLKRKRYVHLTSFPIYKIPNIVMIYHDDFTIAFSNRHNIAYYFKIDTENYHRNI